MVGKLDIHMKKYNNYLIKEQDLNVSTKTIKILGKT